METPREGRSVSDAQVRRKLRPILGSICSHGVSADAASADHRSRVGGAGLWHSRHYLHGARRLTGASITDGSPAHARPVRQSPG